MSKRNKTPRRKKQGLGADLAILLAASGLHQKTLAARAGCTSARINVLLKNRSIPSVDTVRRILEGLRQSFRALEFTAAVDRRLARRTPEPVLEPERPAFVRVWAVLLLYSSLDSRSLAERSGLTYAKVERFLNAEEEPSLSETAALLAALERTPEDLIAVRAQLAQLNRVLEEEYGEGSPARWDVREASESEAPPNPAEEILRAVLRKVAASSAGRRFLHEALEAVEPP